VKVSQQNQMQKTLCLGTHLASEGCHHHHRGVGGGVVTLPWQTRGVITAAVAGDGRHHHHRGRRGVSSSEPEWGQLGCDRTFLMSVEDAARVNVGGTHELLSLAGLEVAVAPHTVTFSFTAGHDVEGDRVTEATGGVEMDVLPGPPVWAHPCQHSSVMLVSPDKLSKLQGGFVYQEEEKDIRDALQRRRELGEANVEVPSDAMKRQICMYPLAPDGLLQRHALICGGLWAWCIVVPQGDRESQRTLATYFHEQNNHCHDNAVYRLCRIRYCWLNIGKTILEDYRSCHSCVKNKYRTTLPCGSPKTSVPSYMPLCNICIDVADMVESKDGYNQILVVVCRSTKYCAIIPWKKTWASTSVRTRSGHSGSAGPQESHNRFRVTVPAR
jgi:hypothetical protein